MEQIEGDALVVADREGNYYVLPRELIELSRARPEAKSEVDKHVGGSGDRVELGAGYSFVGVMTLPEEAQWSQFSPHIQWPNVAISRGIITVSQEQE